MKQYLRIGALIGVLGLIKKVLHGIARRDISPIPRPFDLFIGKVFRIGTRQRESFSIVYRRPWCQMFDRLLMHLAYRAFECWVNSTFVSATTNHFTSISGPARFYRLEWNLID
jgi:hypothetical protein